MYTFKKIVFLCCIGFSLHGMELQMGMEPQMPANIAELSPIQLVTRYQVGELYYFLEELKWQDLHRGKNSKPQHTKTIQNVQDAIDLIEG